MTLIPHLDITIKNSELYIDITIDTLNGGFTLQSLDEIDSATVYCNIGSTKLEYNLKSSLDNTHWFTKEPNYNNLDNATDYKLILVKGSEEIIFNLGNILWNYL